jgi:hypothetical protein
VEVGETEFVLYSPGSLTARAQAFLRACSNRKRFDRGLVGERLRSKIEAVYGYPDERIVVLLDSIQGRYGGLTYRSGFFDSSITFSPTCEPESLNEKLEILYAIETGGPAGASVRVDGTVAVGLDDSEIAEFSTLDSVIECDSMFALAGRDFSVGASGYVDQEKFLEIAARISSNYVVPLQVVPEAGGMHTYWYTGESAMLFLCSTWSELGLGMRPLIKVWARSESVIREMLDHIYRLV